MTRVSVLFVCAENICRSPMAQGIMEKLVSEMGLARVFKVDSAGTLVSLAGQRPDQRAQEVLELRGISIKKIRSRKIKLNDFNRVDYIVAMDQRNLQALVALAPPENTHKIRLLTSFDDKNAAVDVPDPYFGALDGFESVYELLTHSINGLVDFLVGQLEKH